MPDRSLRRRRVQAVQLVTHRLGSHDKGAGTFSQHGIGHLDLPLQQPIQRRQFEINPDQILPPDAARLLAGINTHLRLTGAALTRPGQQLPCLVPPCRIGRPVAQTLQLLALHHSPHRAGSKTWQQGFVVQLGELRIREAQGIGLADCRVVIDQCLPALVRKIQAIRRVEPGRPGRLQRALHEFVEALHGTTQCGAIGQGDKFFDLIQPVVDIKHRTFAVFSANFCDRFRKTLF
jgi:hypothetical protein